MKFSAETFTRTFGHIYPKRDFVIYRENGLKKKIVSQLSIRFQTRKTIFSHYNDSFSTEKNFAERVFMIFIRRVVWHWTWHFEDLFLKFKVPELRRPTKGTFVTKTPPIVLCNIWEKAGTTKTLFRNGRVFESRKSRKRKRKRFIGRRM